MTKTILYIATSLDGFVAGKNDDISWLFPYNDVDYGFDEFFSHIGAIIQGRRSYEIEVQHGWETPHPVPTFVLSHEIPEKKTLKRSDVVVFTHEDIAEVLKKAKKLTDKVAIITEISFAFSISIKKVHDAETITLLHTILNKSLTG